MVNVIDRLWRSTPMPVVTAPAEPTHEVGGTLFTSLATPTRGSRRISVWQVELPPARVLLCCFPVGGQAQLPGGEPFTPPWAL
jgi:hypothetical protein